MCITTTLKKEYYDSHINAAIIVYHIKITYRTIIPEANFLFSLLILTK
jgi:hypothetical protein